MPAYDYECEACGSKFEESRMIADRLNAICKCGSKPLLIAANLVSIVAYEYYDHALGERITGPAHKQQIMDAKGLIEAGDIRHLDDVKPEDPLEKDLNSRESEEGFMETWKEVVG